jgi:hypothetical protein
MKKFQDSDGGPAFPTVETEHFRTVDGMSLRDWFAGQAMAAMNVSLSASPSTISLTASTAFEFADAMIAARKTGGV